MEIKIVEQRPNPLLKRTEYRFEVGHAEHSTPSRESIRSELAKDLHVPKERIVVERMQSKFGTPKTVGEALVYTSPDDAKAVEREHVLLRNKLIEKETPKPAGEGAETTPEPAAEKPAEKAAEAAPAKAEDKPAEPPAESAPAKKADAKPAAAPAAKKSDAKSAETSSPKKADAKPADKTAAKPKEA